MAFLPNRRPDPAERSLLVLTAILFGAYLCVAIALPIVPIYVTARLGLANVWAGLAVGSAFLATIGTRGYAGLLSDRLGSKTSVRRGLTCYIAGALISIVAGLSLTPLWLTFSILIMGRLILGVGESLVVVGVIGWGIGLVGPERSGKVLALVGAAIYGALAIGGPVGLILLDRIGFVGAMTLSAVLPALSLLAVRPLAASPAHLAAQPPKFWPVVGRIWLHGTIVCLQGIGFAGISAFFALYFLSRHWDFAGLGLTAFGGGFVLVRILFGHLPDRIGGLPVAIGSLAVEMIGQLLIWSAADPTVALTGAFFTGLGCSMIFPAMGREVVRLIEPQLRSTAVGGFSAFQDLAYGLTGPVLGFLVDREGYGVVFLSGAAAAATALITALLLRWSAGNIRA